MGKYQKLQLNLVKSLCETEFSVNLPINTSNTDTKKINAFEIDLDKVF